MTFLDEFRLLLKARAHLIYILTDEEERLEYTLINYLKPITDLNIYSWNFIDGYQSNPNFKNFGLKNPLQALEIISQSPNSSPALFILKDFDKFLDNISILRKIKNLNNKLRNTKKVLLILTNERNVPKELYPIFTFLDFQLPTAPEIEIEIDQLLILINSKLSSQTKNVLIKACQGLTIEKIRRALSQALIKYKELNKYAIEFILKEKEEALKQDQILEMINVKTALLDIGGLRNLKYWLSLRKHTFTKNASIYGLTIPRGLLIMGIQGTGKSLTVKAIANDWQLPLLKLDVGKLFNGIIGESEKNTRQIIKISEAMAPCILWIDEIEKAFFETNKINDSGTSNRVLGTMLTWLSEKESSVFVIATANRINNLPLEIIRKGRFDEIFFITLPNYKDRILIFKIFLKKLRPNSWQKFNFQTLSLQTKGFSGAEIEQVLQEALYLSYNQKSELNQKNLETVITQLTPLSKIEQHQINEMEKWALKRQIRKA